MTFLNMAENCGQAGEVGRGCVCAEITSESFKSTSDNIKKAKTVVTFAIEDVIQQITSQEHKKETVI